jgi:hypothetical protein
MQNENVLQKPQDEQQVKLLEKLKDGLSIKATLLRMFLKLQEKAQVLQEQLEFLLIRLLTLQLLLLQPSEVFRQPLLKLVNEQMALPNQLGLRMYLLQHLKQQLEQQPGEQENQQKNLLQELLDNSDKLAKEINDMKLELLQWENQEQEVGQLESLLIQLLALPLLLQLFPEFQQQLTELVVQQNGLFGKSKLQINLLQLLKQQVEKKQEEDSDKSQKEKQTIAIVPVSLLESKETSETSEKGNEENKKAIDTEKNKPKWYEIIAGMLLIAALGVSLVAANNEAYQITILQGQDFPLSHFSIEGFKYIAGSIFIGFALAEFVNIIAYGFSIHKLRKSIQELSNSPSLIVKELEEVQDKKKELEKTWISLAGSLFAFVGASLVVVTTVFSIGSVAINIIGYIAPPLLIVALICKFLNAIIKLSNEKDGSFKMFSGFFSIFLYALAIAAFSLNLTINVLAAQGIELLSVVLVGSLVWEATATIGAIVLVALVIQACAVYFGSSPEGSCDNSVKGLDKLRLPNADKSEKDSTFSSRNNNQLSNVESMVTKQAERKTTPSGMVSLYEKYSFFIQPSINKDESKNIGNKQETGNNNQPSLSNSNYNSKCIRI